MSCAAVVTKGFSHFVHVFLPSVDVFKAPSALAVVPALIAKRDLPNFHLIVGNVTRSAMWSKNPFEPLWSRQLKAPSTHFLFSTHATRKSIQNFPHFWAYHAWFARAYVRTTNEASPSLLWSDTRARRKICFPSASSSRWCYFNFFKRISSLPRWQEHIYLAISRSLLFWFMSFWCQLLDTFDKQQIPKNKPFVAPLSIFESTLMFSLIFFCNVTKLTIIRCDCLKNIRFKVLSKVSFSYKPRR